jgi:uncharacterized protein with PQ loop repeat
MPHYSTGNRHFHKHRKNRLKHKSHTHKENVKIIMDKIMFVVGLIGPFMMIPQIWKIYEEKDASSIALSSWILFCFGALCWTYYGYLHKEKVIIYSNIAWIVAYIFVIVGAVLY